MSSAIPHFCSWDLMLAKCSLLEYAASPEFQICKPVKCFSTLALFYFSSLNSHVFSFNKHLDPLHCDFATFSMLLFTLFQPLASVYRCVSAGAFGNMCINNRVKSACISMVIHSQILNRVQIQGEGNHLHCVQKWSLPDDTIWETEKRKKINVLVWVRQNYGNISLIRTHSRKYVSIHKHCFSLSSASFESYQNHCFGQNYHCDKVWGL